MSHYLCVCVCVHAFKRHCNNGKKKERPKKGGGGLERQGERGIEEGSLAYFNCWRYKMPYQ